MKVVGDGWRRFVCSAGRLRGTMIDGHLYTAVIRAKSEHQRTRDRGYADLIRLTKPHRKSLRRHWLKMDRDDYDAAYDDGLIRAVTGYDPIKASFPSFLTVVARGSLYPVATRPTLPTVSLNATYTDGSCTRRNDLASQLPDPDADTYRDVADADFILHHGTRAFAALTAAEQSAVAHDVAGIGMTATAAITGATAKQVDNALERGYAKLRA
jgi:DNA-directed RNA polymerase specialized sigma24 family protein